ncbi:MAG: diguanylate cyclase, partial [Actinomycetota bacterium]|nr:diguanylate cyclase [Actinomycetota bacterium]
VLDRGRDIAGFAAKPGDFFSDFRTPGPGEIIAAEAGDGDGFSRIEIPVRVAGGGHLGSVIGGFWIDREFLVAAPEGVDLSIVSNDRVIASTAGITRSVPLEVTFDDVFETDLGGEGPARARRLPQGDMALVASTQTSDIQELASGLQLTLLGLLLLALIGTAGLAYVLSRLITQPLEELARGAHAIAEGDFDHRIPVTSNDEVGRLSVAFNHMSTQLSETVGQLSSSRDQLRRTVRRVGETLKSTHDMKQMLQSILNTSADAVQADAAVLWSFTSTRAELYPSFVRGVDPSTLSRVKVGEGIVGLVAERGVRILLPSAEGGPGPATGEPNFPSTIAVPLYSQDRIRGVLTTHREAEEHPFRMPDRETIVFLAEQGSVAIENVQLHEEAQRLSLTDGLTGVWNRRYFQMQFRQVLATAQRFERPFSLLMLDLDRFKDINDTHGHQRGDAVLIDFARRVSNVLREVDTFARYGGEEFICLLSETDLYGGARTADKILNSIRNEPFGGADEGSIALTVSIGVASYPEHGDTFKAIVEAADSALYRAKQEGRDRAVLANDGTPGLKVAK